MDDLPVWFAEMQRAPQVIPAEADCPPPLLFDDRHRPITTRHEWEQRRRDIEKRWKEFLGEIPRPRNAPVLETVEEDRPDSGALLRRLVRYEAEPGVHVDAYLLRPAANLPAPSRGRPAAVVLHSTVDYTIRQPAGLEGPSDYHIGIHLARRGFITLCARNFLWQYGRPGQLNAAVDWLKRRHPAIQGMAKMHYDAVRALDALAAQPGVDPKRIGAIGHSLGAKEVLYLAAFDARVRAAVFSEGGIGLGYSNWEAPWYLGEAIRRPGFPLDHAQLLALVAPRAFLLIGGDSADGDRSWPYVEACLPLWRMLEAPHAIAFLNHRAGHAFPPAAQARAYAWLEWFLQREPQAAAGRPGD